MQITAEPDSQHLEKLKILENQLQQNTSEFIAWAIDKIYQEKNSPTEGEKILTMLQKTGFWGSMPDEHDLSENYKDYMEWSDKV